jgi:haloalkane dehalogenase
LPFFVSHSPSRIFEMEQTDISADFNFEFHHVEVLDSKMAYIDTGKPSADTVLFLHGNPTSSYLWRNVIPHVYPNVRCVAPDLIGMGRSQKPSGIEYRFADHARYLDAFIEAVIPTGSIVLVLHDWGSVLGLYWARRHEHRVSGLALMEFIYPIPSWDEFPETGRAAFQAFRDPETSRKTLMEDNAFIEQFLPLCVARTLTDAEMDHYREPFKSVASREPIWRWPNELPISGSPADVFEIVQASHDWMVGTELPKLFFWATPGGLILEEKAKWYAQALKNVRSVGIGPGVHYLQEDNPHLIGKEIAKWLPTFTDT